MDNNIAGQEPTFTITDTKLYVPVVTLSNQDYAKLFEQLKSGFKRTINLDRYEPKVTKKQQQKIFRFLNSRFQGVNRLFVFPFENTDGRTSYMRYYLRLIE